MITEVTVPDIGEFHNIPIIEILVKIGDRVSKDSPLLTLESDKATLDVPSPMSGIVKQLKVALGDRVSLGSSILTLEASDTVGPPATAAIAPSDAPAAATAPAPSAAVAQAPATVAAPTVSAAAAAAPWPTRLVAVSTDRLAVAAADSTAPSRLPGGSPSVRRFAHQLGVDLAAVKGSGPRGRILREDLQSHVQAAMAAPRAPAAEAAEARLAPWPRIDFSKFGAIERTALTPVRRIAGENLARNWSLIPHVTNFEDADITELEAFRKQLNLEGSNGDAKITLLSFIIKAVAVLLKRFPDFNASLDGDSLILKRYVNIGFAADTPNGLVVPVIRSVDTKGIAQIAQEVTALAAQARAGKLKLADMQGGSFTVSSLGGVGGTGFTPIINAPEVAILGTTRAQIRPVWSGSAFEPRLVLPLSLSWDHRVIDGVAAARFLNHLSRLLGDFRRVML